MGKIINYSKSKKNKNVVSFKDDNGLNLPKDTPDYWYWKKTLSREFSDPKKYLTNKSKYSY